MPVGASAGEARAVLAVEFPLEIQPAAENAAVAGLARKLGACLAGRGPGTVEYEVALEPAEYSLDWWFSCVDGPGPAGS